MPTIECVGEPDLRAFVLGQLPERVAQSVCAHLETCPERSLGSRSLGTFPIFHQCPRPHGRTPNHAETTMNTTKPNSVPSFARASLSNPKSAEPQQRPVR
jgi:hypothetical protein